MFNSGEEDYDYDYDEYYSPLDDDGFEEDPFDDGDSNWD